MRHRLPPLLWPSGTEVEESHRPCCVGVAFWIVAVELAIAAAILFIYLRR